MSDSNSSDGKDGGNGEFDIPISLAREGHVVWFYEHKKYLGFEWNESVREIEKTHVADPEHAIYFDTYAHAVVASDRLATPSLVLYSPGKGIPPKVKG
ncbi:hypothetical protein [Pandoraea apista]|uniref:Uncharacterized protein n=1 Tax=Pandoraea apista TaxID=93218 RepID=A0A0B5FAX2_9BURK|nr:hypothetical protein [Pandoraea apista]AJE97956.1 hypothetical protein SG18_06795 [Pandoraea apista]AKH71954.1 hypothetical protein XM39_06810 [Pandoraea apista]AKI64229.1 hypothetical protein AA956_24120 [Pandoraea apista]ALS66645.1 hypothetical protein AT395_18140 [Pandoraea apista]AVF38520.1 hypothetical protein AL486_01400 [Pandoraea apista]